MYWLLISSTLYDVYVRQARRGAVYKSPDGLINTKLYQLGFVDDVNNRTNLPWVEITNDDEHLKQLIHQASTESQL
jgi:hypothetical protein